MKKLKLVFFTILTLGLVSFAFIPKANYSPVFAEGEEPTSSQPVETSSAQPQTSDDEEVTKWKDMYNKAVEKYNQISNYQILGMTIGGIVSVLVSLGLTYLMGKVNRDNIRKQGEQLKESANNIVRTDDLLGKTNDFAIDFKTEVEEFKAQANLLVEKSNAERDAVLKQNEELKTQIVSERQMFLSIISNDKDLVANGTAEKINKLFSENK